MGANETSAGGEIDADERARRKAWLMRLADEMEKLVPLMPLNPLPDDPSLPKWVDRVGEEFGKSLLPAARLKHGKEITPKRMGALIGHQCANAVWIMEWFGQDLENTEVKSPQHMTKEIEEKGMECLITMCEKWYPAMRRYAKRALCSAVDQSYEDMSDFLQGYADGFRRKPRSHKTGDMGSTSFEIYLLMLWYWRYIETLASVRQLHEFLVKVLGSQKVGELKRVEKICQRVGLHFRKPGRPKKSA